MTSKVDGGAGLSRAVWRKSGHSGGNGSCVEVATSLSGVVAVRDSKRPDGPELIVAADEWRAFVSGIRSGRLAQ